MEKWGRWDLNPGQRVSTRWGATPPDTESGSQLQSVITESANPLPFTPFSDFNWSPPVYQVSLRPHCAVLALPHLLLALPAAHLLLAPLPALLSSLLPRPRAALHCDLGFYSYLSSSYLLLLVVAWIKMLGPGRGQYVILSLLPLQSNFGGILFASPFHSASALTSMGSAIVASQ